MHLDHATGMDDSKVESYQQNEGLTMKSVSIELIILAPLLRNKRDVVFVGSPWAQTSHGRCKDVTRTSEHSKDVYRTSMGRSVPIGVIKSNKYLKKYVSLNINIANLLEKHTM